MVTPPLPARFRPLRVLGEGGMGVVFEAFDEERQEVVAVKTIRATHADAFAAFKREFRVLQGIRHPNLVALGELVAEGENWCFSMELVEGTDFLSYVRPSHRSSPSDTLIDTGKPASSRGAELAPEIVEHDSTQQTILDEAKLRESLRQLAMGLEAMHGAGLVHRDVKPRNVLVTATGRVALLDFGVAVQIDQQSSIDDRALGTPAYMAPEQVSGGTVTTAADWYAFGAILYEALAGRPPFLGSGVQVMLAKHHAAPPPPPLEINPHVSAPLSALAMQLLSFDPSSRPRCAEIMDVLGARETADLRSSMITPIALQPSSAAWVGRADELALLRTAWKDVRVRRTTSVVIVKGDSGVGKSALVRRFLDRVRDEQPRALVLTGRCYLREDVPFRAVDGVIDSLVHALRRLPSQDVAALIPSRPGALARVFPAMRRVEAIARLAAASDLSRLEPLDVRRRAAACLRDLLDRVAAYTPVVVFIDDLHWADADGLAMLSEILRPPESPALLLIATVRGASSPGARAGAEASIDDAIAAAFTGDVRTLVI
ncbi:MAG: serine/threonine-protein kinase, partial [Polyangiales bacterium]